MFSLIYLRRVDGEGKQAIKIGLTSSPSIGLPHAHIHTHVHIVNIFCPSYSSGGGEREERGTLLFNRTKVRGH